VQDQAVGFATDKRLMPWVPRVTKGLERGAVKSELLKLFKKLSDVGLTWAVKASGVHLYPLFKQTEERPNLTESSSG